MSTERGGRTIGTAPARARARTYGIPSAISCWGGSPSGSGWVFWACRTSEVVTPTRGLLSIPRRLPRCPEVPSIESIPPESDFVCRESSDRHLPPRRAAAWREAPRHVGGPRDRHRQLPRRDLRHRGPLFA